MRRRPIGSLFEEVGASDPGKVDIRNIKSDRLELDNIVFDLLNLTYEERLDVYRAVIDLVKARIERAKSVARRKKRVKRIDVDALIESVLKEVGGGLKRFPEDYIGACESRKLVVPRAKQKLDLTFGVST